MIWKIEYNSGDRYYIVNEFNEFRNAGIPGTVWNLELNLESSQDPICISESKYDVSLWLVTSTECKHARQIEQYFVSHTFEDMITHVDKGAYCIKKLGPVTDLREGT